MTIVYEWCAEMMDGEDVQECLFGRSYKECLVMALAMHPQQFRIVLVRDKILDGDLVDRQWALSGVNGDLPSYFTQADGSEGADMPGRFLRNRVR